MLLLKMLNQDYSKSVDFPITVQPVISSVLKPVTLTVKAPHIYHDQFPYW